ncbi:MAG TPA: NADH-quinone oxidoreductase subunit H [Dehalococcoidia bacterium]|nr:NADH-quinone oxidoreductase subunit H [Dehalococcoidia bacterium]
MSSTLEGVVLAGAQIGFVVMAAPLLNGVIKKLKARLQLRQGPPLLQGYADLAKWLSKSEQVAESTSFVHRLAPVGILAAVLTATLFLPLFGDQTPVSKSGDLLVVVGLFALGRALLTLAGMDSGASFGQMGSSREVAIGSLVEPVLLMSLVALTLEPQSTRLGEIVAFGDRNPGVFLGLGWALAAAAFCLVLVAETGRIPVDNPDTHLELTMVHEAMLIEYSGRSLGMLHYAAMIKQLLLAVVLANVFLPFGMARLDGAAGYLIGASLVSLKVGLIGVGLALTESAFAKMRLFQLPDLIGAAGASACLGVAVTVLFA